MTSAQHNALRQLQGMLRCVCLLLILCAASIPAISLSQTEPPLVALASSFRGPWPDLMRAYQSETGHAEPRSSFGSSGLLTTQIRHGAPFALYLSADAQTVEQLHALGKTMNAGITLARGTVSLVWQSSAEPHAADRAAESELILISMKAKLGKKERFKLAIPNPQHAPYGIAARQVLETAGLWPLPRGYLLSAENAAQTLQFALSGAVDYAIVPDTLVMSLPDNLRGLPVSTRSYEPVVHQMVLLNGAGDSARALFDWLQSDTSDSILSRYGLIPEH